MDSMQILSRLYDLLSQCSDRELREAASLAGNKTELGQAILLLRQYKHYARKVPGPMLVNREQNRPSGRPPKRSKFTSNGMGKKLEELVMSKKYFRTNKELGQYLRATKVPFKVDPKDSRRRFHAQIVKWIEAMPPDRQRNAYFHLLRILPKSETSGWFDAIREST